MKSEARNPKSEGNPKAEIRKWPLPRWPLACRAAVPSDLGFRISFGFRLSGFGFRQPLTDLRSALALGANSLIRRWRAIGPFDRMRLVPVPGHQRRSYSVSRRTFLKQAALTAGATATFKAPFLLADAVAQFEARRGGHWLRRAGRGEPRGWAWRKTGGDRGR